MPTLETDIQTLMDLAVLSREMYVTNKNTKARVSLHKVMSKLYDDIDVKDLAYNVSRRAQVLANFYGMTHSNQIRVALFSYNVLYAARKYGYGAPYVNEGIAYHAAFQLIVLLKPSEMEK